MGGHQQGTNQERVSPGHRFEILDLASHFENTVLLIAGRTADKIGKLLQDKASATDVEIINLQPLEQRSSNEYLQNKQKQLHPLC